MDFFVVCRRRSLKFPRCLLVRICTLQSSLVRRSYVARVPNRTLNTRVTLYTGRYCSNLEEKDRRLMTARDTGTNDDGQSETTLKTPSKIHFSYLYTFASDENCYQDAVSIILYSKNSYFEDRPQGISGPKSQQRSDRGRNIRLSQFQRSVRFYLQWCSG